jgi:predicted methyltransferase
VVGAKGHVYAVIPESLAAKAPPEKFNAIHALLADPTYEGNISLEIRSYDRLDVGAPLDVVWTSQNYHDVCGARLGSFNSSNVKAIHSLSATRSI